MYDNQGGTPPTSDLGGHGILGLLPKVPYYSIDKLYAHPNDLLTSLIQFHLIAWHFGSRACWRAWNELVRILRYRVCWRDGSLYPASLLRPRSRRLFQVLAVVGLPISACLCTFAVWIPNCRLCLVFHFPLCNRQTFGTNCVICLRSDHDLLMTENKLLNPWFTPRPRCQTAGTHFHYTGLDRWQKQHSNTPTK